jgi:ABC-2 type transport system ATP-binding protein
VTTDADVVDDVRVAFGQVVALDGVDLRVPAGTTLAVLGTIDAIADPGAVRRRTGVTSQYAGLDHFLGRSSSAWRP